MKSIILFFILSLGLSAQVQQQMLLSGGTDVPNTPTDSNSGGGCTGSSGAWTCTGAPTITITDATASLIYYSTNGTTPNCTGTGTLYSAPFTGPGSTFTLKAIGCNGITGGGVLTSVYTISGGGSVAIRGVLVNSFEVCSNMTTCTYSMTVTNSGDSLAVFYGYCNTSSCVNSEFSGVTMSDGTNSYTYQSCANAAPGAGTFYFLNGWSAANVTAGTYTLSIAHSAGAFYYMTVWVVELSGANTSTPVDSSACNGAGSTGTTPSVTSTGNVGYSNEVILALIDAGSTFSLTGAFSLETTLSGSGNIGAKLVAPSSGSTVTASGSQTSAPWSISMMGIRP